MKFHFVGRRKKGNNTEHQLIGVSTRRTQDILKETSFSIPQAWGNLNYLIDYFSKSHDGKYLLLRSGDNQGIRIYSIPSIEEALIANEDDDNN